MGDRLPPPRRGPRGPFLDEPERAGNYYVYAAVVGLGLIGAVAAFIDTLGRTPARPAPALEWQAVQGEERARRHCAGGPEPDRYACLRAVDTLSNGIGIPMDRLEAVALAELMVRSYHGEGYILGERTLKALNRRPRSLRERATQSGAFAAFRLARARALDEAARRSAARDPRKAAEQWRDAAASYESGLAAAEDFETALKAVPKDAPARQEAVVLVSSSSAAARPRLERLRRSEELLRRPAVLEAFALARRSPDSATPEACARLAPVAEKVPEPESVQFELGRLCHGHDPALARRALERGLAGYERGPVDPTVDEADAAMARSRLAILP